jgi:hypothetical protein
VLEFGGKVAFEIVLDDEDTEKVRVAASAQDVPGEGRNAKGHDCSGMKETEGVTPALGKGRPEKNSAAGKNDRRRAFCQYSKPEEETEEQARVSEE